MEHNKTRMEETVTREEMVSLVKSRGWYSMWNESYWEIDNVNDNQLFVGKDPAYPNEPNPLNPGLDNFGTNLSVICYVNSTRQFTCIHCLIYIITTWNIL